METMFAKIEKWHGMGLWGDGQVRSAAEKGVLTPQQAQAILGGAGKRETAGAAGGNGAA